MTHISRTMGTAMLLSLCIAAAACDGRTGGEPNGPVQTPLAAEPAANAAATPKGSIMRPSVMDESEPAPPPKPAPQPLRATIYFDSGQASLGEKAKATLSGLLQAAAASPSAPVTVRGHSDSKGDAGDNLLMSAKRANAVRAYLVEHGIAEQRIATVALGEEHSDAAADANGEQAGSDKERRVEIVVEAPSGRQANTGGADLPTAPQANAGSRQSDGESPAG